MIINAEHPRDGGVALMARTADRIKPAFFSAEPARFKIGARRLVSCASNSAARSALGHPGVVERRHTDRTIGAGGPPVSQPRSRNPSVDAAIAPAIASLYSCLLPKVPDCLRYAPLRNQGPLVVVSPFNSRAQKLLPRPSRPILRSGILKKT